MSSQYPAKIDDNISLPLAADNSSLVRQNSVNNLREAILAVEAVLGINPASVYGSVKERLAVIESAITAILDSGNVLVFSGDLSGTTISQTVVGLQGNSVSSDTPTNGEVLTWSASGEEWVPEIITIPTINLAGSGVSGILPLTKEASPTSTGLAKVSSGNWVSSASTLVNADVSSSASIDYSKLGTGTQSLGAQQFASTVDSKGTITDVQPKNIQTTTATPAAIDSFTIASNSTLMITSVITAVKSDNSLGACYIRTAAFRNNAGTVAQIGTTQDGGTFEDDTDWDATIDNSTTTIRIMATGKAATTIRWACVSSRLVVVA